MNIEKIKQTYKNVVWVGKKCFLGLPLSFTTYILTKTRLITRTGFLSLKEDEIELYRITDKKIAFPVSQRMFGCGTITLTAADSDTPNKVLQSIKSPRAVKERLDNLVDIQRKAYSVRGRDMFGAASRLEPPADMDIDTLF